MNYAQWLTFQQKILFSTLKSKFEQNAIRVPIIIYGPRFIGKSFVLDAFYKYLQNADVPVVIEDFSAIVTYSWESFSFHPYYPFAIAMKNFFPPNHEMREKLKKLQVENSASGYDNNLFFCTIPKSISEKPVVLIIKNLFNSELTLPCGNESDHQNLAIYLSRAIGNAIHSLTLHNSNLSIILEYSLDEEKQKMLKNDNLIYERLAISEKDRLKSSGNRIKLGRPTKDEILKFNEKNQIVESSILELLPNDESYPYDFNIINQFKKK